MTIALVFFTWGEVYSLFPSACADLFGAQERQLQLQLSLQRQRRGVDSGRRPGGEAF